ncbi:CHAT domain-containing protein [Tirmania nivea]|nr:CHAT domain-containing protein [Tirmania nivea]
MYHRKREMDSVGITINNVRPNVALESPLHASLLPLGNLRFTLLRLVSPYRATMDNLENYLSSRYEQTGNPQELQAAITQPGEVVEATTEDHPDQEEWLNNLGNDLYGRYERTGNLQDLDAAIVQLGASVEAAPKDHPDRAGLLDNLGNYLSSRYEQTGSLQDLQDAIVWSEAAVEETPEDHPNRARRLINLGYHMASRYDRTGYIQDLEAAIVQSEAALGATPENHPDRSGQLNNLGNHLSRRYERTGNLQDLEAAIVQSEAAVEAAPEDHPNRAILLNNLGFHLGRRYKRTGSLQDLEAAIARVETAVEVTSVDHPDRVDWLNNLGTCLDLEAAIVHSEAAVEATPGDHPSRARRFGSLGNHLSSRYERTANLQDLEAAIVYSEAAVEATPEDHPNQAILLNNLGNYLSMRYGRTGYLQDLEAAITAHFASWSISTAPTLTRLDAALRAAKLLVFNPLDKDLSIACPLLHDAIHLMPLAPSRSLGREDQQYILGQLTGLASLAAAVSLNVGQSPLEALRLQELGRSITNSQLLDYRIDISDLMAKHPTLAKDFDSLRRELDSSFPSTESTYMPLEQRVQTQQAAIRRRNKVAKDLDTILQQIRQNPGFENFLRAESKEHLLSAAQEGPIVVLNVTVLRSDAILLTKAQVSSIALPHLSHASMTNYFGKSGTIDDNKVKRQLLEWLWKAAVQPVLQELGFYPKEIDPLPRVWWIGVGLMAKAPIHAATKYKKGLIKMTTLQYCLPSYTSTIRALQYSRSRKCQQNTSMLIVTMPTTPGASSLSGVTKEAGEIKHSLQKSSIVETLERPTAERVLQALPNYSIAHFACHGVSSINPADSHLLLSKQSISHDGLCTEEIDKLRVKDIAALALPAASSRLAYLSACSTANSTATELVDEVTHIVSAFHIAGFINVIGTLWPAQDEACQKMAADFYSMLSETDNVALSYRKAVLGLMKQKPTQPIYWAPFIHFGA